MSDALAAWLYGEHVASIYRTRSQLRLQYTEDVLARFQLGTPLLSLALPLRPERFTHLPVKAFIDGLLPEGEPRRAIALDLGLRSDDSFGLIRELGRDCAGAIVIQPDDQPPPPSPTTLSARQLSEDELAARVANLRQAPLGIEARVRLSLAGVQEKLLLTRLPDGSWGQPVDGTPSTHIFKPEVARYPNTVENELFCMRLAGHLKLSVANVQSVIVAGRQLLVVERFDRSVDPDGTVHRLHQEDFCQATGTPPEQKYEEHGGPSLRRIATILQDTASNESVEALLRAVTLNVLIGNGDAHAKNFSLVHERSGRVRLAPLYDLLCTLLYLPEDRLAMFIDGVHRQDRATAARIVNEAARWGMSKQRAREIVMDVLDRFDNAVLAAAEDTPGVPQTLLDICTSQLAMVRSELP